MRPQLDLTRSEKELSIQELPSVVPTNVPRYHLYRYNHHYEGAEVSSIGKHRVHRAAAAKDQLKFELIVNSSTIGIFFEITKFSKILSKFTFISNITFEIFRKKMSISKVVSKIL